MGRIRTIKPEFPQSESMGRVSRDARLLFVLLWTVVDDEGRTRGSSRMLASLLYPYDDDAGKKIDNWIAELVRERCIVRYEHGGDTYIAVVNWDKHQRIDKFKESKLPPPPGAPESSREESTTRRDESTNDPGVVQDASRMDWNGMEGKGSGSQAAVAAPPVRSKSKDPDPPTDFSAELATEWRRWFIHRREIKKPVTPESATQFAIDLRSMGERRAIAAIRYTIGKGWQGLREPDPPALPFNSGHTTRSVGIIPGGVVRG